MTVRDMLKALEEKKLLSLAQDLIHVYNQQQKYEADKKFIDTLDDVCHKVVLGETKRRPAFCMKRGGMKGNDCRCCEQCCSCGG